MRKEKLPCDKTRRRVIKAEVKTNPNYGKKPEERRIEELLDNCLIFLDKPQGPTSHQVDSWVKKILDVEKLGHAGTLDPNATGVLPIGVGYATKSLQALLPAGKEYVGVMSVHGEVDKKKVLEISKKFVGKIVQMPPVRSAVKRRKRERTVYYLDILEKKGRNVLFRVGCESGTYVRALCTDIGKKLGVGAHLSELRRTRVGLIHEDETVFLQDLKDSMVFWKENNEEKMLRSILQPVEKTVEHLPKIVVRDSAVDAICHGADLAIPGVAEVDEEIEKGDEIAVMTLKGEVVALMNSLMKTKEIVEKDNGICADVERVLMKKGTYPPIWKKS
ncbi:MAG: RNA-guided pseudouridylation complex pseudouridine synthase subunit Cbf5 [Candidatus Thermoplasmatota archaeon]